MNVMCFLTLDLFLTLVQHSVYMYNKTKNIESVWNGKLNGTCQHKWRYTLLSVEMYQKAYNHPFLPLVRPSLMTSTCVMCAYKILIIFKNLFMKILIRQNFWCTVYIVSTVHLWVLFVFSSNVFVLWCYFVVTSFRKLFHFCVTVNVLRGWQGIGKEILGFVSFKYIIW